MVNRRLRKTNQPKAVNHPPPLLPQMNPYLKETLNLQIGDYITWQDQPQDLIHEDGTKTTYLTPGMKGRVVDIHDGNPPTKLETVDTSTLPWAFIKWQNGETSAVDLGMKWGKVNPGTS